MRSAFRLLACRFCLACLLLPTFLLSEDSAFAQQSPNAEPGFAAEGIYDSGGIDSVSLFNGALSLTIPLGIPYPSSGGFSHQLRLVYHSTLWDSFVYSSPCSSPSECPVEFRPKSGHDAGLGWRLALPQLIPPGGWNQTAAWIYVSADGGEHTFYDKLHFTDSEDSGDSGFDQLVRYTRDGTYLRFKRPSETSTTITVELPGGDIHTFSQNGGEWHLASMKDRFGKGLDLIRGTDGSGNATLTLDDGFRQHVVTYEDQAGFPDQPRLISRIDLAAFDGETATYSFQYATKTVFRPAATPILTLPTDLSPSACCNASPCRDPTAPTSSARWRIQPTGPRATSSRCAFRRSATWNGIGSPTASPSCAPCRRIRKTARPSTPTIRFSAYRNAGRKASPATLWASGPTYAASSPRSTPSASCRRS